MIGRVLEVKEQLTELNGKVSFVNLDDVLVDLKLSPAVLEVPVPRFFIEDQARQRSDSIYSGRSLVVADTTEISTD